MQVATEKGTTMATSFFIRARSKWSRYQGVQLPSVDWHDIRRPLRIHHTGDHGPTPPRLRRFATLRQEVHYLQRVEEYHVKERGYSAIAYNHIIFPSGRTWEGRGFEKQGAHTKGHNSDPGVCFVGNFEVQKPSGPALKAFAEYRKRIQEHGAKLGDNISHDATFPTACCGKNLKLALGLQ